MCYNVSFSVVHLFSIHNVPVLLYSITLQCVFSSYMGITLGDYPKYQTDAYDRAKELTKVG